MPSQCCGLATFPHIKLVCTQIAVILSLIVKPIWAHADIVGTTNSMKVLRAEAVVAQEMLQRGVVPNGITEKELAEAFSSSPDFASQTIHEARRFRASVESSTRDAHGQPQVRQSCAVHG